MGTVGKHMSPPVANLAIHVMIVFQTVGRISIFAFRSLRLICKVELEFPRSQCRGEV